MPQTTPKPFLPALGPNDMIRTGHAMFAGIRNPDDHEDAVSEYVVGCLEALAKAEAGQAVRNYQYATGRGRALAFLKHRRKVHEHEPASADRALLVSEDGRTASLLDLEADPTATDPQIEPERADQAQAVRALLDLLPEAQSETIRGRYLQGRSMADLAQAAGISAAAVRLRERTALARLRKLAERAGLLPAD